MDLTHEEDEPIHKFAVSESHFDDTKAREHGRSLEHPYESVVFAGGTSLLSSCSGVASSMPGLPGSPYSQFPSYGFGQSECPPTVSPLQLSEAKKELLIVATVVDPGYEFRRNGLDVPFRVKSEFLVYHSDFKKFNQERVIEDWATIVLSMLSAGIYDDIIALIRRNFFMYVYMSYFMALPGSSQPFTFHGQSNRHFVQQLDVPGHYAMASARVGAGGNVIELLKDRVVRGRRFWLFAGLKDYVAITDSPWRQPYVSPVCIPLSILSIPAAQSPFKTLGSSYMVDFLLSDLRLHDKDRLFFFHVIGTRGVFSIPFLILRPGQRLGRGPFYYLSPSGKHSFDHVPGVLFQKRS